MVIIKTDSEIMKIRKVGKVAAKLQEEIEAFIKPGVTTEQIDKLALKIIKSAGGAPSSYNYNGFPKNVCVSVNEELIHGIPSNKRVLVDGDIVSVDAALYLNEFHADCARTYPVGNISKEAQDIIEAAKNAFFSCLKYAREGYRVSDLSAEIQKSVESDNYAVIKEYVGHGIGRNLHEDPAIPNYGKPGHGIRLKKGMTLAIEPMISIGDGKIKVLDDDWTVVTRNNKLSAHYENTILITESEPEILTL